jgi:dTDP-4-dehydrorhamnose 3,5-epimerase-like enzyme
MKSAVKTIKGDLFNDKRGSICFANNFQLNKYKRFYIISLPRKKMIRAFHGHMKERKAVFPISGSLIVCIANINNPFNPSKKNKVTKIILDSRDPKLIEISPKYANGIMSLEKNTSVIFFSDKIVEESEKDDYRFDAYYWGKEIWNVD